MKFIRERKDGIRKLFNIKIDSIAFCSCGVWVQDTGEKITWTQNIVKAMKMPKAEGSDFITSFSLSGHFPTCKNCERSLDFYYCKKYFDELEGTERTCKMCQVDLFGKCSFYDELKKCDVKLLSCKKISSNYQCKS